MNRLTKSIKTHADMHTYVFVVRNYYTSLQLDLHDAARFPSLRT